MFKKILIANRGEIACRIIKTAKKMGIVTIAIYSEIDVNALHVQLADESYCVGPAPSSQSYLNKQKIISIAKSSQAGAIHPGYGFLSEDDEFAELCEQSEIIFVGPSSTAIRMMGDKNLAKTTMINAGVPTIPGFHDESNDFSTLTNAAQKIGLPLLVKASAGGGGKGMRLVEKIAQLPESIQSAQREAQASFGDSRIFLEKYLPNARHIEVQILFDRYGQGIYLFDRDCSTQRRHQKVIEEAPAPGLSKSTRQKMAETALRAGQAIGYSNAGTIEFLVDEEENFYFMEMNTRLQVEHPVTEMITGLDLVEWQLKIASGEKLTLQPDEMILQGHAIEARLYAENPQNNFMPSAGKLKFFKTPNNDLPACRIDTGFQTGDQISIYYDPLLAKLIAWGPDRQQAIAMLRKILNQTIVVGIETNLNLLHRIVQHSEFTKAKITTQFLDQKIQELLSTGSKEPDYIIAAAALAFLKNEQQFLDRLTQNIPDQTSPWLKQDNWRLIQPVATTISFWLNNKNYSIKISHENSHWQLKWNHHFIEGKVEWLNEHELYLKSQNQIYSVFVYVDDQKIDIFYQTQHWIFLKFNVENKTIETDDHSALQAPMPGTVIEVLVKPGQEVSAGQRLLIIEAMKMEHTLSAPNSGQIEKIFYQPGDQVNSGAELISIVRLP